MSDLTPPSGDPIVPDPVPPTVPQPPAAAAPPPPPPSDYPQPPPSATGPVDGPWNVGAAFSYGWAKFTANVGPILIAMLVLFIVGAIISVIWFAVIAGITNSLTSPLQLSVDPTTGAITTSGGGGPGFFLTLLLGALGVLVYYTVLGFVQAAVTRAALALTEGRPIETSTLLSTDRLGPIAITALLVSVFTSIGYLFCGIGAVIVAFFLTFSMFFLLDQNLEPMDAIKASVAFVREHLGDLVVFYLASIAAYIVGAILCGVGLIVAVPVVIIATAYTYKKLTNQAVAA